MDEFIKNKCEWNYLVSTSIYNFFSFVEVKSNTIEFDG